MLYRLLSSEAGTISHSFPLALGVLHLMDEKSRLIENLDRARETMRALLRDLEAEHAETRELYPTWTIKELLSHITGWDDASIASLRAHSLGNLPGTPAARGIDPYNASTVLERQSLSLEQVIREWEYSREEFKQAIRDLPEEKLHEPFVFPWGPCATLDQLVEIF